VSNGKEMVSITRETAKQAAHLLAAHSTGPSLELDTAEELRNALEKPAEQHQGEPVERADFIVSGNTVNGECTLTILGRASVVEPSALAGDGITDDTEAVARELGMSVVGQDALTDLATWKRRAIEAESKLRTYDPQVVEFGELAMQALLAEPRPSELVLTRCRLCDQLQADLTERDQRIDFLEQQVQLADHWLEFASFNNVGEPIEHTQEMRDEFRKQMIAAVFPDLESRPEERGTPETEPCSGCGTPGWTGACNKCVPY